MLPLFSDWTDKEVGGIISGMAVLFTAASYAWKRITQQHGENVVRIEEVEIKKTAQEEKTEDGRYDKWLKETRNLLKLQDSRIKDLEAKIEEKDREIADLRVDVSDCQADRATLAEQGRWMKRILKKAGLLSDDDEQGYPRTKSDQIDTGGHP